MSRMRLPTLFGVVFLALASAENATLSTLATPTTPVCICAFNAKLQQNELLCQAPVGSDEALSIVDVVHWNCTFVKIDVSNHDVASIPGDAFESTPHLQIVYLYSDYIRTIDREAFRVLKSLVDVDLNDNSLLTIDADLFADNHALTKVSLSDNPLVDLKEDSPILRSESITDLDLSFCKLTKLTPEMFAELPNLSKLDLSSNSIQQMSLTALEMMPKLASLDIGNNRWVCGCAFRDVLEFSRSLLLKSSPEILEIRCLGPENVSMVWNEKLESDYNCPEKIEDEYFIECDFGYEDSSSSEEADFKYDLDEQLIETTEAVDTLEYADKLILDTNVMFNETDVLVELTKTLAVDSIDLLEDSNEAVENFEDTLEYSTTVPEDYAVFTEEFDELTNDKTIPAAGDSVKEINIAFVNESGDEMIVAETYRSTFYILSGVLLIAIMIIAGVVVRRVVIRLQARRQDGDWSLLIEDGKETPAESTYRNVAVN